MKISNILQSGFEFSEEEHELRLKYILFNSLVGSNVLFVSIAALLRFTTGHILQGFIDVVYVTLAIFIIVLARYSRKSFPALILCMMSISVLIVSLTYKILSSDIAGISWFLVLILTVFYLTEKKFAYAISLISFLLIIYISATSEVKNYTATDIFYGILPLLVTLVLVRCYERRNSLSRDRLRILNSKLKEKVQDTTTELSISEDRFRNLIENISDWVWEIDREGVFVYASPSVKRMLGYEPCEVEGILHGSFLHERNETGGEEFLTQYSRWGIPFKNRVLEAQHKDGHLLMLEVSGQPIFDSEGVFSGYQGVTRDISGRISSEKTNAELKEQLHQAQKMEAIGTLAGGIAHDFNNILSAILGYAEITKMNLPAGSNARENIDQVLLAGKRATALVRQILTFSRKHERQKSPLRIDLIVKEALQLLRSSLPTTINIRTSIDSESGLVLADPTSIHQIVVNLCTNASHAIGNAKGMLEVNLSQVNLGAEQVADKPLVHAGSFVVLMVKDNGDGMDEEITTRIFEPYFTTKEQGEGTGLGLAVIHGIVEDSNGFVEVESYPGEGTCFHVYLPLVDEEMSEEADETEAVSLPRGNERILIVDDEPELLDVAEIHLSGLGYSVTTKTKSTEALAAFLADPDCFDLVITDQTMPDVTGAELAQTLLKIKPDLPIILYTGYTSALSEEDAYGLGIKSFIEKPVSKEILSRTVRRLLDGGALQNHVLKN